MCSKRNATPGNQALEINHLFHPVFLSGHFRSRFETKYMQPVLKNRQIEVHVIRHGSPSGHTILQNLVRLHDLQQMEDVEFQTRNLLSETWLLLREELRDHFSENIRPSENESRLRQMLLFIHSRYSEKLTLKQIAACANISEREALRCFQSGLHQSPIEYLISYRLNSAKQLLLESDFSMTEIAYRCGFSDASYFSKAFRSAVGVSPMEYRKAGSF